MSTPWLQSGSVILAGGSVVLCADCPCTPTVLPCCDGTPATVSLTVIIDGSPQTFTLTYSAADPALGIPGWYLDRGPIWCDDDQYFFLGCDGSVDPADWYFYIFNNNIDSAHPYSYGQFSALTQTGTCAGGFTITFDAPIPFGSSPGCDGDHTIGTSTVTG